MSAPTIKVTLTPELKDLVEAKVRSGRYLDTSEVIREALRTLEAGSNQSEDSRLESLIEEGLRSGPARPITPDTWKQIWASGDRLAQRSKKRRSRKAE